MARIPGDDGVSEIIGIMLLVGVTVLAVAVVAAILLSGPQPDEIPHATIVAGNESGRLVLAHDGGDPLREGEYRIYIETESGLVERTRDFTGSEDGVWSIGGRLVYVGTERPGRVVVTAVSGSSETILAEPAFVGGGAGFSPDPVEPGDISTLPTPPPPDSVVVIDLPGGEEGSIPTKDAEIIATITSNQTAYVHTILYNYDETQAGGEISGGEITALRMTRTEAEEVYTSGKLNINSIGGEGDTIAVVVIAYDSDNSPIASLTTMGILRKSNKNG